MVGKVVIMAAALLAVAGCDRWEKKLDARRIELRDSATACPAPATCTDKHHGDGGHDFKVCAGGAADAPLADGDIVLVHEIGIDMVAKVHGPKGAGYAVEFADGNTLERGKGSIVSRVCK